MISIGNHVRITEGVKILTHDYSWSVLKNCRGGCSELVELLKLVIMYLLEIINLYLSRTSEESLDEKSRQKIRIEILEKAVTEYANLSR